VSAAYGSAVLFFTDPWAHELGGSLRVRALLRALRDLDYGPVCLFPSANGNAASPEDGIASHAVPMPAALRGAPEWLRSTKRQFLPMPTRAGAVSASLSRAVEDLGPLKILAVESLAYVPYWHRTQASLRWFDVMDLWGEYAHRESRARNGTARLTATLQARAVKRAEADALREADLVTAAGWSDAQLVSDQKGRMAVWIPTPVETSASRLARQGRTGPRTAGFLADFRAGANLDALDIICRIWEPRLRAKGWRVVIGGRGSKECPLPSTIVALGDLQSVNDFYDIVDVTLAPLRLGGGLKHKVIESLGRGVPIVASAFALDGLPPTLRSVAIIVDIQDPDFRDLETGLSRQALVPADLEIFTQKHMTASLRTIVEEALVNADN
jgi:hypothetical protein